MDHPLQIQREEKALAQDQARNLSGAKTQSRWNIWEMDFSRCGFREMADGHELGFADGRIRNFMTGTNGSTLLRNLPTARALQIQYQGLARP